MIPATSDLFFEIIQSADTFYTSSVVWKFLENFLCTSLFSKRNSLITLCTIQDDTIRESLACVAPKTRTWANAQRDGRPAYYRWRPLFNAAVWLTPTTSVPCSNASKTRNPLKFAGVPQTRQQISAVSRPKFTIL